VNEFSKQVSETLLNSFSTANFRVCVDLIFHPFPLQRRERDKDDSASSHVAPVNAEVSGRHHCSLHSLDVWCMWMCVLCVCMSAFCGWGESQEFPFFLCFRLMRAVCVGGEAKGRLLVGVGVVVEAL